MLYTIKNNINAFRQTFKNKIKHGNNINKSFRWMDLFILLPIMFIILFVFKNLDDTIEEVVSSLPTKVKVFSIKITDFGRAEWIIVLCTTIIITRLFINGKKIKQTFIEKYNKLTICAYYIMSSVIISGLISQILKFSIERSRPNLFPELAGQFYSSYSMPSGHSTTLASLFICVVFIIPRLKYLWMLSAIFFACTRIFAGLHYLSDVIFGLTIGTYTSIYTYYLMKVETLLGS